MERTDLLDWDRADDAVGAHLRRRPWCWGPVLRGRTRSVYVDLGQRVVYKLDRVRGTNDAERCELMLRDDLDGIPDWTWVQLDGRCVIVMELIAGRPPAGVDRRHPLVAELAAEAADVHPNNFVVDDNGKLWCIDLGP